MKSTLPNAIEGACHCGSVRWTFEGDPGTATACNCTVCRKYGALWAYDWVNGRVSTSGRTSVYTRGERELGFHYCPECGCVTWWQGMSPHADGRTRIAVNLRMAEDPSSIGHVPIRHFDGLDRFEVLPSDDKCVADMWS